MTISTYHMILAAIVVALGTVGTYLMLPHRHGATSARTVYGAGLAVSAASLLVFLAFWTAPGPLLTTGFFYFFGATAIVGGLLTITSRNPVYSALWFASVVLSTAGLFFLAGAPFLAAGSVIVYAGAIIVTFLFVIMLAQMDGKADYDRSSRSPEASIFTSYLLFWCLIVALSTVHPIPTSNPESRVGRLESEKYLLRAHDIIEFRQEKNSASVEVLDRVLTRTSQIFEPPPPAADQAPQDATAPSQDGFTGEKPNVAGLGGSLYTDHLVTVGLAGALLFVALIAAVAITNPKRSGEVGADPAQAAALAGH